MNKSEVTDEVLEKAKKVKLLLMDCDGVLTDGKLYFTEKGEEIKVFHVRDGQGIVMWHQAGFESGIISGRKSKILYVRATELGMHYIKDGSQDKAKDFEDILQHANVSLDEVAFIGDDIADICLMKKVGFAVAVADAVKELFPYAIYTTKSKGGFAAVREVTDLLLAQKKIFDKATDF
ncbi:MAG: HAD hydrolase family protein [Acidobacteriota bacterium]|nr:HAD hydrolase family protein [Acidobacteriota bacterium]